MKFELDFKTWASKTVTIDVPEEKIAELAEDLGKEIEDLTINDLVELAEDTAFQEDQQSLCIHCVGAGMGSNFSLDIGDWELDDKTDREEKYRGIRIKK